MFILNIYQQNSQLPVLMQVILKQATTQIQPEKEFNHQHIIVPLLQVQQQFVEMGHIALVEAAEELALIIVECKYGYNTYISMSQSNITKYNGVSRKSEKSRERKPKSWRVGK